MSAIYLVTMEQARGHLRIDLSETAYDDDVQEKLAQASDIILDYLELSSAVPTGWDILPGDSPELAGAPGVIQSAVLLVLGELWKNREAKDVDLISLGITRLLARYRMPASA